MLEVGKFKYAQWRNITGQIVRWSSATKSKQIQNKSCMLMRMKYIIHLYSI